MSSMTEVEALELLDNLWDLAIASDEDDADILEKAVEVGIKALEKQIAKKVLIKHHEKTPWTREISQYLCPCCDRVIGFNGQIHCSTCGQKLLYDWGNEDDW